ncbi:hypothetical protein J4E93_002958 [Alternaria ventricosa]|uniref:uncharacterized protein n=1 Tax=Alternaria ventricosa TaxID=1187951 RepID=UPI0020C43C37|nr:uncharacterized protein J4E93_002958 [Alternaria ventricosa]KAI4650601.1 hypothetical protein J4E93_002958 [Alternaria ventricosa]
MVPPKSQQQQEQDAWDARRVSWLLPEARVYSSPMMSTNYGNNYVKYGNMSPHIGYAQDTPAVNPIFAPQYSAQQFDQHSVVAPPNTHRGTQSYAHSAHPSEMYASLDEAMAAMPSPDWSPPFNDDTLPTSDARRQQWVQRLLDAVNNVKYTQGNKGKDFQKRWSDPVTGPSNYYLFLNKLILCWKIEDLVERLHRFGPSVLHSFDDNFWESAGRTRGWTFQHRMNQITELLAVSKTRCDSLLGGSTLQNIVANPGERAVATRTQARQNAKRGKTLKVGRVAKKRKARGHQG